MMPSSSPILLTIAGSDSSAGAGVQADIKTAAALGVYALSVITVITAQNTQKIEQSYDLPADVVEAQLKATWADFDIGAIKIGLLGSFEIIDTVASFLTALGEDKPPVVLDPVICSSSGTRFLDEKALVCLKDLLLPLCDVITPNIDEAEALLGREIISRQDMEDALGQFQQIGYSGSVVITGGEGPFEKSCDVVLADGEIFWIEDDRVITDNSHGTGCTFSTALACELLEGMNLVGAVEEAKLFVSNCLREARASSLGKGKGPLLHSLIK